MGVKRKREADWSELADDALECIVRKLSLVDMLRFKTVCTSWFSVAQSYSSSPLYNPSSKTPWLVLSSRVSASEHDDDEDDEDDEDRLRFFNLDEKKEYRDVCKGEEVCNGPVVGSSHGWLLLEVESKYLVMLNPFSGVQIPVASLKYGFIKAVLSSDPRSSEGKNLGVVVIYPYRHQLGFCCRKDGKFIDLACAHRIYQDIAPYSNNLVCGLSCKKSQTANVEVWDFSGSSPAKTMDMRLCFPSRTANFLVSDTRHFWKKYYLVESGGELLFVARFLIRDIDHEYAFKTMLFHVYRLDWIEKKWVEVETMGDQALFIDENHCMSLKSGGCGGWIGNSIYFIDPCYLPLVDIGRSVGVYNLEDASVKPFCEINIGNIKSRPFWCLPNP